MNTRFFVPVNVTMSDENSEPSIEHNQYQSDSETDSNTQSLSSESLLSDGFLEDNEIVGLTEFDLGDVNSPDNTANFETEINVLLADASPIAPTPQPFNVTEIPTESVDIPIKIQTTSTMSKLVKCREFSGYPQDNAKGFFSEFESYALLHELPETDKRRIAAFHLHLKGPALTWYNSLSDESKSSWIIICVLFKEKYINFSWQSATVKMESEIFQNMVLSQGQSLEDYFSQLSEKAQILGKDDHDQSEVIRDLQKQIAILTDLVQGKHKERVQSEPSRSDFHDIKNQIGQLSGLITSMAVREVPKKEPKRPENLNTNYTNTSRFDSSECRRCKGLGHFQRACNWNGIAALVHTGSSINVISKSLYDSISDRHKLYFEQLSESEIRLANNDKIRINGISKLQATIHQKNEIIETYIIPKTSHPLILGTEYLRENKIVLDFSDFSCNQKTVPVKTAKRIELEPNTEYLIFGKLPNYVTVGLQGICVNSKFSVNHKFLVAKSLVVVPVNRKVPIKLLNASNMKIMIPKGKNIAEFQHYRMNNIQLVTNENGLRTDNSEQQCDLTDSPDRSEILTKVKTDFDLSDHLTDDQKSELAECLFDNLDLFVTKENPNLGYTHLVEQIIPTEAECYDVMICSETFEKHLDDIKEIFKRFRDAGLKLGQKKCHFASETCIFLGHEISKHGIRPPKDQVKAIVDFPAPQNLKQLRRTIGLFNWFKKFIPNFSAIISPLTKLLKKNQKFEWKIEQSTAFQNLKTHLVNTDNLPRFDLPFILAVDTSSKRIGHMLYQKDPTKEKQNIIRFGSKSLSRWQQSYGPTKLELLGMVTSILDCADYLRGTEFIVECDHQALQPLFMKQFKGAIYERWLAILQ
ncbi:unnamed protein product [Mytilus coruscus]|uniref:RNA-directed DNA polymerase n=1 Tax=Mytilus coruscus TaxID=42192 RepID=A0A6J8DL57_MYTCO|nr:unnamed protein product [Mytilus coruscus]